MPGVLIAKAEGECLKWQKQHYQCYSMRTSRCIPIRQHHSNQGLLQRINKPQRGRYMFPSIKPLKNCKPGQKVKDIFTCSLGSALCATQALRIVHATRISDCKALQLKKELLLFWLFNCCQVFWNENSLNWGEIFLSVKKNLVFILDAKIECAMFILYNVIQINPPR